MPKSRLKIVKGKQVSVAPVSANPVKEAFEFAHDVVARTPVPRVAAFGVIAMAAVSLLAMLPVASVELSQAVETPNMAVRSVNSVLGMKSGHDALTEQVLGTQTYEPTVVFANKQVKVSVTPYQYDSTSGKWNYKVSWYRAPRLAGSIKINGNLFVEKATGTGDKATGFTLDPNAKYYITFLSQNKGKGVRVANNRPFTVMAADEQEPVVDVEDPGDGSAPTTNANTPNTSDRKTSGARFEVLTRELPAATVGVPYTAKIAFRYIIPAGGTNYASNATFRGLPTGIGTGSASGNTTTMGILPGLEGPNGLTSVTISGIPTTSGTFKVNLALTDQYSANADQSFVLNVSPKPTYGYSK